MKNLVSNHKNNFDFLRLLFASFVVLTHSYVLLGKGDEEFFAHVTGVQLSSIGVLGFFVISGYLIQQSLQRSPSLQIYFKKRIKRILPALFAVVFFSVFVLGSIFTDLPLRLYFTTPSTWLHWLANSFLIPLFPNLPGVFREHVSTSAINGSLWTLRYEFLFYGVLGLLFVIPVNREKMVYGSLCIAFFVGTLFTNNLDATAHSLNYHLNNFFHLGLYFILGSNISLYKDFIFKHKKLLLLVSLVTFIGALSFVKGQSLLFQISFPLLIICVGYAYIPFLNYSKFVGDISYGTYIYAFPVQQALIAWFHFENPLCLFVPSLVLSSFFGYLSWNIIEKKFIMKKYITL